MEKNFYVKGYETGKPKGSLSSFWYVSLLGLLILAGAITWLFWNKSAKPDQVKSAAITRNRVISPIPPAPDQESMSLTFSIPEGDGLQETAVASVQESMDSLAKDDYLKQEDTSEGKHAVEDVSVSSDDRGFVIQVGAFRRRARAENLQKALKDKGYDAYLEKHTLPEFGLFHRVRIRGYASLAAARAEMERLHKEEGLDSIILKIEPDMELSGRK
jgi:cell division septation protein DedD